MNRVAARRAARELVLVAALFLAYKLGRIVVEGRDIGTVVAPDADVKVYLTADPDARAVRRAAERSGSDVQATREDLIRRDTIDSGRAAAPLTMAADARHIDTTPYSLEEVVDQVVALVHEAREGARP